jgi:hypothetical protein
MTVDDPVPVCANTGKLAIPISITAATAAHPAAPDNSLLPNFTPQTTVFLLCKSLRNIYSISSINFYFESAKYPVR